jgi:hypothetical protein
MKTRNLIICLIVTVLLFSFAVSRADEEDLQTFLIRMIPARPSGAMTGSEFARYVSPLDRGQREQAILQQFVMGNLPDFLRRLTPIHFHHRSADGRRTELTIFAMPDYLAIGSNRDFILIPMSLRTALAVAADYGFTLPTRKIVDAIFAQSAVHLVPQPLPAGPRMRSTAYYEAHNEKIGRQRTALHTRLGDLISGHKKDVVLTNRLRYREGKIAIYGWHFPSGTPIQPLSTIHGANYADYSHGIRLISDRVLLDGHPRSLRSIMDDPALSSLLSDEGPIGKIGDLLASRMHLPPRAVEKSPMWAALVPPRQTAP